MPLTLENEAYKEHLLGRESTHVKPLMGFPRHTLVLVMKTADAAALEAAAAGLQKAVLSPRILDEGRVLRVEGIENERIDEAVGLLSPLSDGVLRAWLVPTAVSAGTVGALLFDMDSTLIEEEGLDEIARIRHLGDRIAAITREAMEGRMDFRTAFLQRVRLLKGIPLSLLLEVGEKETLRDEIVRWMTPLLSTPAHVAILSGGLQPIADTVAKRVGIRNVRANPVVIEDGLMTGEVIEPITNRKAKYEYALARRAEIEGTERPHLVAFGDGSNDMDMLSSSHWSVGVMPKAKCRPVCDMAFSEPAALEDLRWILPTRA